MTGKKSRTHYSGRSYGHLHSAKKVSAVVDELEYEGKLSDEALARLRGVLDVVHAQGEKEKQYANALAYEVDEALSEDIGPEDSEAKIVYNWDENTIWSAQPITLNDDLVDTFRYLNESYNTVESLVQKVSETIDHLKKGS